MKTLRIAAPAAQDLADLVDFIAQDNARAAENTYRAIVETARKLPQFPALGRAGRHPNTREVKVADLPYLIVYTVGPDAVIVVAIFHTARDLAKVIKGRL